MQYRDTISSTLTLRRKTATRDLTRYNDVYNQGVLLLDIMSVDGGRPVLCDIES